MIGERVSQRPPPLARAALTMLVVLRALTADPPPAGADGGLARVHAAAGPFAVTLFSAPTPLRVGPADLSVLVQDAASDATVLDATVRLSLTPPEGSAARPLELAASAAQATNKLLYAANAVLDRPGAWRVRIDVERGSAAGSVATTLPVEPAAPPLATLWPYLAIPPVAIALYALNQWLKRRTRLP